MAVTLSAGSFVFAKFLPLRLILLFIHYFQAYITVHWSYKEVLRSCIVNSTVQVDPLPRMSHSVDGDKIYDPQQCPVHS